VSIHSVSDRFFLFLAKLAVARPWLVLIVSLVLTGLATYASIGISINTSTEGIFSPKAEFIRNVRAYEQVFPSIGELIVAVIEAPDADRAQAAARSLAETLRGSPLFRQVEVPGAEP